MVTVCVILGKFPSIPESPSPTSWEKENLALRVLVIIKAYPGENIAWLTLLGVMKIKLSFCFKKSTTAGKKLLGS